MYGHPAAILAVVQQPVPSVVFELIALTQPSMGVLRVLARDDPSVGIAELDQALGLHKGTLLPRPWAPHERNFFRGLAL